MTPSRSESSKFEDQVNERCFDSPIVVLCKKN